MDFPLYRAISAIKEGEVMNHQIEHPYAWLDLNALDSNIQFVNSTCKTKPVRITTKSIRRSNAEQLVGRTDF